MPREVGPSRFERIVEGRRSAREALARAAAVRALAALAALGVTARVTGSLARGAFNLASDVDLLVVACPEELRYRIEGAVEDAMDGLPFHVLYLDEVVSPTMRARLLRDADREPVAS